MLLFMRKRNHPIIASKEAHYGGDPESPQQNPEYSYDQTLTSAPEDSKIHAPPSLDSKKLAYFVSLSVSLFIHRIAHILFDPHARSINYLKPLTYIWLPCVFSSDAVFLITLASVILFLSGPSTTSKTTKSRIMLEILRIITLVAFLISMVESFFLATQRESFDWSILIGFIRDWQSMKILLETGASGVKTVPLMVVCGTCLAQYIMFQFVSRKISNISNNLNKNRRRMRSKRVLSLRIFVTLMFSSIVNMSRPAHPYDHLSHMPIISVILEVKDSASGIKALRQVENGDTGEAKIGKTIALRPSKELDLLRSNGDATEKPPVNVVLIILESIRSDLMPFNKSTAWANKFIKWERKESLTPFYTNLTQDPSSLYVRHKSASGITHKALVSMLCSLYAQPLPLTKEHKSRFYRQCLPRHLENSGFNISPFFKSMTTKFDHFEELIQNIGYEKVYGFEDYDLEHKPTEQWRKEHEPFRRCYEDDLFIKPMMNWVDSTLNRTSSMKVNSTQNAPFFLSYLTGITHWPYNSPPIGANWNKRHYTARPAFNRLLNGIAYSDRFLSKVFDEFENRGLTNSTLFVVAGDHGVNLKNRGGQMTTAKQEGEESFDVGVTFHSRNKQIAARIATAKEQISEMKNNPALFSSIDIVPTILDFLSGNNKEAVGLETPLLNGSSMHSIVDGRSMLMRPPSSNRLTFSINNPGDIMVLRDKSYVITVPIAYKRRQGAMPKVWDLRKDPFQLNDMGLDNEIFAKFKKNKLKGFAAEVKDLLHWGTQASKFVERVEIDLVEAHQSGRHCTNCTLFLLNSLKTLEEWVEFEALDDGGEKQVHVVVKAEDH